MNGVCDICNMRASFITNFPVYGKVACEWCYFKAVHPIKHLIDILKRKENFVLDIWPSRMK